jgi:hypothetical protein
MVDHTAQLPEESYRHKYGDLGGIVPDRMDGLDMGILHRMGMLVFFRRVVEDWMVLTDRSACISSFTCLEVSPEIEDPLRTRKT